MNQTKPPKSPRSKSDLRQHFRALRRAIHQSEKDLAALSIADRVGSLVEFKNATKIGVYWATPEEIPLKPLIKMARSGNKDLFLPVIDTTAGTNTMQFQFWTPDDLLVKNKYGIPEPVVTEQPNKTHELDIIFVPLVAYDKGGNRLGMGAGFYDRYFAEQLKSQHTDTNCLRIGIAHSSQFSKLLQHDAWDVCLHGLVNEKEFIDFR